MMLEGKRVLVTGGGRRIGRALALACAREGADVAITYLHSADSAEQTVRDIAALDREALAIRADVRDAVSVRAACDEILTTLGGLDVLINNAASYHSADLAAVSVEAWDDMFATNTRGPLLVAQACLPALRQSHGHIVNIGSLGGIRPWAEHAHYCSSKAALHMLTLTMAKAWAPQVSANCVAPGMIQQEHDSEVFTGLAEKTPMQRNGSVADVAAAVLFFSTAPLFITGQIVAVDGGLGLLT